LDLLMATVTFIESCLEWLHSDVIQDMCVHNVLITTFWSFYCGLNRINHNIKFSLLTVYKQTGEYCQLHTYCYTTDTQNPAPIVHESNTIPTK
jgi:hypothetical protein